MSPHITGVFEGISHIFTMSRHQITATFFFYPKNVITLRNECWKMRTDEKGHCFWTLKCNNFLWKLTAYSTWSKNIILRTWLDSNYSRIQFAAKLFCCTYMNGRPSKIRLVYPYVMTWKVYFGWICTTKYFCSKLYSTVIAIQSYT